MYVHIRSAKRLAGALKRGTGEGVTTLRELLAKFGCVIFIFSSEVEFGSSG
jgi:hypothetical protein